jgi:hypothetical protein
MRTRRRWQNARKRNRLRLQAYAIEKELKSRPGDQRRALLPLYNHPNVEVRLMAAKATLAITPMAVRRVIETIADSRELLHAGDAGMCLAMLDRGEFVPD